QQAGRLAHAYCLTGEEAIGKTAVARALAEELLLGEGQPSRLEVHPDFWSDDRPEAISIDEIRFHPERGAPTHEQSLQQFLSLKPFVAPLRVALLANAERMTEAAQNCLLKTLEEPPPNTVLVLTTAYPDHLLPTCLSRCQLIALSPVGRPAMVGFIKARQPNEAEADALVCLAAGRPGWVARALTDRDWVVRVDRWAEQLAALGFEDADGGLTYAARAGQGPQAAVRLRGGAWAARRDASGGLGCAPRFHRIPPLRDAAPGRRAETDAGGPQIRARSMVRPGPPGPRAGILGGRPAYPVADRSECKSSPRHGSHAARPSRAAPCMSRVFVTLPLPSPGIDMLRERFEVTMMEAEGMPP